MTQHWPIQEVFRPTAEVSIFDPQGNLVREGKVESIYGEESYIDAPGVPKGLIQPGFSAVTGYSSTESQKPVLSFREVLEKVIQATAEEKERIRREIAQKYEREKQESEKYQEEMTKSLLYLDYQYSDYYYRYR